MKYNAVIPSNLKGFNDLVLRASANVQAIKANSVQDAKRLRMVIYNHKRNKEYSQIQLTVLIEKDEESGQLFLFVGPRDFQLVHMLGVGEEQEQMVEGISDKEMERLMEKQRKMDEAKNALKEIFKAPLRSHEKESESGPEVNQPASDPYKTYDPEN